VIRKRFQISRRCACAASASAVLPALPAPIRPPIDVLAHALSPWVRHLNQRTRNPKHPKPNAKIPQPYPPKPRSNRPFNSHAVTGARCKTPRPAKRIDMRIPAG